MANQNKTKKTYWKMSADEKAIFLNKRGLTKKDDVVMPIAMLFAPIGGILLCAVALVFNLLAKEGSIFNGIVWSIGIGIVAIICLGMFFWLLMRQYKEKKGFFINQYYAGDKDTTMARHEEINQETATTSMSDMMNDDLV